MADSGLASSINLPSKSEFLIFLSQQQNPNLCNGGMGSIKGGHQGNSWFRMVISDP